MTKYEKHMHAASRFHVEQARITIVKYFSFMRNVTQFSFQVVHHLIFYCNEIGHECIWYSKER